MKIILFVFFLVLSCDLLLGSTPKLAMSCRDRSSTMRQDGGLCFEIPPWQFKPVMLDQHIMDLKTRWESPNSARRRKTKQKLALVSSEVSRYLDTVITPFLETYHKNIQTSYQQFTTKLLKRIKEDIATSIRKKNALYKNLTSLADKLGVSSMCDEERRAIKTFASRHVAQIYACTEHTRGAIAKMGKYADEMITITKRHMTFSMDNAINTVEACRQENKKEKNRSTVHQCLKTLSRSAVALGYELDLSLTNARRHNEQSCERLTTCCSKAKKYIEESAINLRDSLNYCVYA